MLGRFGLFAVLGVAGALGCGGDEGEGEAEAESESEAEAEAEGEGSFIYGLVRDAVYLNPVAGSEVTVGATPAMVNDSGYFTATGLQGGAELLVQVTAPNYAPATKPVLVPESGSTFVQIMMLPFEGMQNFNAEEGGTVTTGDGASVTFPAGSLAATGPVTAYLASLNADSTGELAAFPGDFTTSKGELLESFGAIAIEVRDAAGSLVELADGQSADATIPSTPGAPAAVGLWSFDTASGTWQNDGGQLMGCDDGSCAGSLPHLSWWNADQVAETTCMLVCVTDEAGSPSPGVEVVAEGVDYNGRSSGFTGTDGCACLDVKRAANVSVTAIGSGGVAGPIAYTTSADTASCGAGDCDRLPTDLIMAAPKFQAILTWSEQPSDLDSHFTGPCPPGATCSDGVDGATGAFHVYYSDSGNLAAPPYAYLDTDDTSSYGPEITTLTQCYAGTYRYAIHNYSGSPGIETSMAIANILLPSGETRTEVVPTAGTGDVWIVGDLACDASQNCEWTPVNTFGAAGAQSYHAQ